MEHKRKWGTKLEKKNTDYGLAWANGDNDQLNMEMM